MNTAKSHDDQIENLAHVALRCWSLEGAALRLLNRSEDSTYLVTPEGAGARVILRVHRAGYHTINGIKTELAWMRALQAEAGVTTPQAIAGLDGEDVQTVSHPGLDGARQCALFEFIEGTEPAQDEDLRAPFKQLGEVTAHTHNHTEHWHRPPFFERQSWDFEHSLGAEPNWGPWTEGPNLTPDAHELLARTVDVIEYRLAHLGKALHRCGLIHADFRLANLLIHEGNVRVIDFDDCGLGWFLYDAASAVTFFEDRPEVPALLDAWLEGYRRVRPLAKEDETELWTLIMMRRLTVFAWFGSHNDTLLVQQEGPGYCKTSCELAELYLQRFG